MDDNLELKQLIDMNLLQKFQDSFAKAMGMASLTVDNNGAVTNPSNFTEFCMELTRKSPEGARRCNECDIKGGQESGRNGKTGDLLLSWRVDGLCRTDRSQRQTNWRHAGRPGFAPAAG